MAMGRREPPSACTGENWFRRGSYGRFGLGFDPRLLHYSGRTLIKLRRDSENSVLVLESLAALVLVPVSYVLTLYKNPRPLLATALILLPICWLVPVSAYVASVVFTDYMWRVRYHVLMDRVAPDSDDTIFTVNDPGISESFIDAHLYLSALLAFCWVSLHAPMYWMFPVHTKTTDLE